jgi:hypothetical protein
LTAVFCFILSGYLSPVGALFFPDIQGLPLQMIAVMLRDLNELHHVQDVKEREEDTKV